MNLFEEIGGLLAREAQVGGTHLGQEIAWAS
jgi:hypothetical protein